MKPPGLMSENPKLKTDFYPANWCLSLAVSFWGLRRVKYAWIQHGWFNLLRKKENNKQMTWNLYLAETNRIQNWFLVSGSSAGALTVYSICCSLLKRRQTHLLTEHIPNWCIITHTYAFTYTHMLPSFHWLKRRQTFRLPQRPIFQIYSLNSPNAPLNECN